MMNYAFIILLCLAIILLISGVILTLCMFVKEKYINNKNKFLFEFQNEKLKQQYEKTLLEERDIVDYEKLLKYIQKNDTINDSLWKDFKQYFRNNYLYWKKRLDDNFIHIHNTCILEKTTCKNISKKYSIDNLLNCAKNCQNITIPTTDSNIVKNARMVRKIENQISEQYKINIDSYIQKYKRDH